MHFFVSMCKKNMHNKFYFIQFHEYYVLVKVLACNRIYRSCSSTSALSASNIFFTNLLHPGEFKLFVSVGFFLFLENVVKF